VKTYHTCGCYPVSVCAACRLCCGCFHLFWVVAHSIDLPAGRARRSATAPWRAWAALRDRGQHLGHSPLDGLSAVDMGAGGDGGRNTTLGRVKYLWGLGFVLRIVFRAVPVLAPVPPRWCSVPTCHYNEPRALRALVSLCGCCT
jgi:hypothetical protein